MTYRAIRRLALVASASATMVNARQVAAQSLEQRIVGGADGDAQFTFASRSGVCGDGTSFLEDGLGGEHRIYENGNFSSGRMRRGDWQPCVPGPVRVVVFVTDGRIIRLRTYAGPIPAPSREVATTRRDLGEVSVTEAVGFLSRVAERGDGRAAQQAVLPIVLADGMSPWPTLLRFAREERVVRAVRSTAAFWLSRGASAKLGVLDTDSDAEDDVRASAVFALSQQPRSQSVPQLIEIVRSSRRPAVRAQALFWLGQTGDARAIELFAEILGYR